MNAPAPWSAPGWADRAQARLDAALTAAGRPRLAPVVTVRSSGRACIQRAPTAGGTVWIKHGYGLPPGEERVLATLSRRWRGRVPDVVATWPGAVVMEALPGRELEATSPVGDWTSAARALAEIAAGEAHHADEWLRLGVRDRRPPSWPGAVAALLESPVVRAIDGDVLERLEALVPRLVSGYVEAFTSPATLVHQDSGCCNIHVTAAGPVVFDWADVVIGLPVFSCDRLLDQVPVEHREPVVDAFCEACGMPREAFAALRRSNVLHEVLRYHDELAFLAPTDPTHGTLARAVQSQVRVLVEHETGRS